MKIIHITPEFTPFAKVGGLADVVSGLSKAHATKGHTIEVILPYYDTTDTGLIDLEQKHTFSVDGYSYQAFYASYEGIGFWFLDLIHPKKYFQRGYLYGGIDEIPRFIHFSNAALSFLSLLLGDQNLDILHLHDWASGSALIFLKLKYPYLYSLIRSTVFTIHNLQYQGHATYEDLQLEGLTELMFLEDKTLSKATSKTHVNLMQCAIDLADAITVVSSSYAKEIMRKDLSYGMHETLHRNYKKIHGILNGIDASYWNFEIDSYLPFHISQEMSIEKIRHTKRLIQQNLFKELNLKGGDQPLVCAITRMVEQKGPHLIQHAIEFTQANQGNFILLAGAVEDSLQDSFSKLKEKYQNHPKIFIYDRFNERLAHLVYAASDIIVIPSLFEPCGLTQMIAMRYGTIPLAREIGGLKDSIKDFRLKKTKANGFLFTNYKWQEMEACLRNAFITYRQKDNWENLILNAMKTDFSWEHSGKIYEQLYQKLIT